MAPLELVRLVQETGKMIEKMGKPTTLISTDLISIARLFSPELHEWLIGHRKEGRSLARLLRLNGYVSVLNQNTINGKWYLNKKQFTIYAPRQLRPQQRLDAACKRVGDVWGQDWRPMRRHKGRLGPPKGYRNAFD